LEGFLTKLENRETALEILFHAIRGAPTTRNKFIGKVSVERMEQDGHIFVEPGEGLDRHNLYIRMPFLFIYIYNSYLRVLPPGMETLFNHEAKITWQTWESFNAVFEVFNNNFLVEKGNSLNTIGNIYHRADGSPRTKGLWVLTKPVELVPLLHQFPSSNPVIHKEKGNEIDWTTHKWLFLNAASAPFGDVVSFRAVPDNAQSNSHFFGRCVSTVVVSSQQKWDYYGKEFSSQKAIEEHEKAVKTAKGILPDSCGIITVCFTTQPFNDVASLPDGVLVVHQGNFKDYYGPFATRATFAIAHSLNPNFADIQHLQVLEGVGPETAKAIVTER
jgi:hypothetical protein